MIFLLLRGTLGGDVNFQRKDVHMLVVIVSTTLEEALDTLRGDVDFQRKGISCATPKEASGTLHGDVKFWRNYVSLCKGGGNNVIMRSTSDLQSEVGI